MRLWHTKNRRTGTRPAISRVYVKADANSYCAWTDDPEEIATLILTSAYIITPYLEPGESFAVTLSGAPGEGKQFDESVWLSLIECSHFVELTSVLSIPRPHGQIESIYTLRKSEPLPQVM